MPLYTIAAAAIGAAAGVAVAYRVWGGRRSQPEQVHVKPFAESGHPALRYGAPVKERIRHFSSYVAAFDPERRNASWTIEHLTRDKVYGDAKRAPIFREDLSIPERFRSKLKDFQGSGLDRGHLVPFMDHKASQEGADDTFYLTNISPQVGKDFNRDYWARFEKFVKDVTKRAKDVYVVTGPIFAPRVTPQGLFAYHGYVGTPPQAVAVPTHFFKVVLAENPAEARAQRFAVAAFAVPNRALPPQTPVTSFVVPLDFLESVTGIEFFPRMLNAERRAALDAAAIGWRRLGLAQQQALSREGVPQPGDALPGSGYELVPAALLPTSRELLDVSVSAGHLGFRPAPTDTRHTQGAVHLCELVACRLPRENFWEGAGALPDRKSSGRTQSSAQRGGA